eukprot:CAMPEP_0195512590 /NCGR_PEP_ID=MMETSP0794_2-20130614/4496_1 /TAXON_ID=515487 /ORGANISM="Stephanopyxis turris, Strain CCMP 815" /LENGTH=578 /DNA_ID=CAMNT_0040640409 /DNA_START=122 /DNA_END=1855 /DNA_ORIENTATION=+
MANAYAVIVVFLISFFNLIAILNPSSIYTWKTNGVDPYVPPFVPSGYKDDSDIDLLSSRRMLVLPKTKAPVDSDYLKNEINNTVWFAGMTRDASVIKNDIFLHMIKLNCIANVSVHILTTLGIADCMEKYNKIRNGVYRKKKCARFDVELEPDEASLISNRVERIAYLRDYQREKLRKSFGAALGKDDIIIIADIDLYSLPSVSQVVRESNHIAKFHKHDALCAAGIMHRPFGYYDTFATVLLPDTFVYPVQGRLSGAYYSGENTSLVRSKDVYGEFTQWDLLEYFEKGGIISDDVSSHQNRKKQQKSFFGTTQEDMIVPVKSCFGGLTIYSATKWFNPHCHYNMNITALSRYANKNDERPCEHVVFHDCLIKNDPSTSIAVHSFLRTSWNSPNQFGSRLAAGPIDFALVTHFKRKNRGDRLANGKFILRINEKGELVVESWDNEASSKIFWKANSYTGEDIKSWTHMVLIVKDDGEVLLVKLVPNSFHAHPNETFPESFQSIYSHLLKNEGLHLCDKNRDICPLVVWSSGNRGPRGDHYSYALVIGDDGTLKVLEEHSDRTLWSNEISNGGRSLKKW